MLFFFSSRRRHTRLQGDWSSDVCSSDLRRETVAKRQNGPGDGRDRQPVAEDDDEEDYGDGIKENPCVPALLEAGHALAEYEIGRASCRERAGSGRGGEAERRRWTHQS